MVPESSHVTYPISHPDGVARSQGAQHHFNVSSLNLIHVCSVPDNWEISMFALSDRPLVQFLEEAHRSYDESRQGKISVFTTDK